MKDYAASAILASSSPEMGQRAGAPRPRAVALDVWQVMETVWASDGNVDESAAYLGLRPDQVRAAISYYAEFPGEIDHWIQRNHDEADRLYLQWGREQASLRR